MLFTITGPSWRWSFQQRGTREAKDLVSRDSIGWTIPENLNIPWTRSSLGEIKSQSIFHGSDDLTGTYPEALKE
ncbi:hypothetical protein TSUD_272790 [Trifolium subterraneum]|uniref:Uncharacterized protein n=1 Tax=Trifolium subterraneum TaxID=3900 RepID=A0A2Z6PR80_TRISU|nr:hypothetical protein TSUD_272790 [Trifolium subterraneum]